MSVAHIQLATERNNVKKILKNKYNDLKTRKSALTKVRKCHICLMQFYESYQNNRNKRTICMPLTFLLNVSTEPEHSPFSTAGASRLHAVYINYVRVYNPYTIQYRILHIGLPIRSGSQQLLDSTSA